MNKLQALPWWSSIGWHKPHPAHEDDYADMGTAFGLDASMGPAAEANAALPAQDADAGKLTPAPDRLNGRSVI